MKTTSRIKQHLAAATLVAGLMTVVGVRASAATIDLTSDIVNPSFETPLVSNANPIPLPVGWTLATDPFAAAYLRDAPYFQQSADGNQYLTINITDTVSQVTSFSPTLADVGKTLTLSVALGSDGAYNGGGITTLYNNIALTIGSTAVFNTASSTSAPLIDVTTPTGPYPDGGDGVNGYGYATASYFIESDDVGKSIGIELINPNGAQGSRQFDNVTLSLVPEPSTWAMMFAGLALLGGLRRFKRQA